MTFQFVRGLPAGALHFVFYAPAFFSAISPATAAPGSRPALVSRCRNHVF
jgi:hypothetical protein